MENILPEKYHKIFLIAFFVILALPIVSVPPWFHPAPWGKAVIFRIIMAILLFLFILLLFFNKKGNSSFLYFKKALFDRQSKAFLPLLLLMFYWVWFLLATIFSKDPFYSFWESPFRAGGFLNLSFYIIFCVLAYLILRGGDWIKLFKFSLIIGILASLIAIFQYFEIFSQFLIPSTGRPPSTFGNSVFLAIYLLMSSFIAFYFFLKEKKFKKWLYLSVFLLFLFIILITNNRSTYLGLFSGFSFFFLLYPAKNRKILIFKVLFIALLSTGALGVYWLNAQEKLPNFIENSKTLKLAANRLLFSRLLNESRFPAWDMAVKGILEKPLLGWGPENFSLVFDKHYDPRIAELNRTWWDRTHNFILDIGIAAGIPAIIAYCALFGFIFWQLQKLKKKEEDKVLLCHILQGILIAYLTAEFFSFDSFSTYTTIFLLLGYSLYLINSPDKMEFPSVVKGIPDSPLWKTGAVFGLFLILAVFIWSACLKPMEINSRINWGVYYAKKGDCKNAVETMDEVMSSKSIIDAYAKLQYAEIMGTCISLDKNNKYLLAPKAIDVLKEAGFLRPNYTRIWITIGTYSNIMMENKDGFKIKDIQTLQEQANTAFSKAYELSPLRQETLAGWTDALLHSGRYKEAKEMAEKCIEINQNDYRCPWKKALALVYLQDFEEADKAMAAAHEKGQSLESSEALSQLHRAYLSIIESAKDNKELQTAAYEKLAYTYKQLAQYVDPRDFQYRASAARIYQIIGDYRQAREQALYMLLATKDVQENVKAFLDLVFSLDHDQFQHHFAMANFYSLLGSKDKALQEAKTAKNLATGKEKQWIGKNCPKDIYCLFEYDIWKFVREMPNCDDFTCN